MTNLNRAIVLISLLVTPGIVWATHNSAESIEARVAPIGSINFGSATTASVETTTESSEGSVMDGPAVYALSCASCHDAGVAGAPITGKAEDWTGRLDAGMETLVGHAINGFQGSKGVMPAKGGNVSLSDEEVTEAVRYMVSLLDADSAESDSDAAMSDPVQADGTMQVASGSASGDYVLNAEVAKQVYASYCTVCHGAGVAGAPVTGDKASWEPRLAQGMEVLLDHAVNGFQGSAGVMPAKGGFTNLSDEEVAQAVYYMVEQLK
ncbi:MAG: c-type cytochrome [Gammaproteobacteria bacterium]|nr:c-type cytochrome [Gammaproteobacteria bacterium]MCY4312584.1 c-type cytochrome [Gammaproteobacteria bacterium]